ncbi:MAG: RagB/SusD family nutrient uptake outer membrane protein, partial [Bacteroides sp.]|nr:RagB/SusD family nutrient uptake outer membrane protein [Bacteroides sp.]
MNFKYIKHIAPATLLCMSLGLGSCVNDLDVTPIDPSTVMTPDFNALFTKCYANMAVAGNGGANGDCEIDGLDGGTTGFVRQVFND